MANSYLQNPVIINTNMTQGYKALTATQGPTGLGAFTYLRIEKVYWENPGTIGDTVNIEDPVTGNVLLVLRCEVANQSQIVDWTAKPKRWSDFEVNTISSGTLYLYLA
jgi:hypothetical protein